MDPVTQALALATALVNSYTAGLTLLAKVWDATDPAQQKMIANDLAKTVHNILDELLKCQAKIDSVKSNA